MHDIQDFRKIVTGFYTQVERQTLNAAEMFVRMKFPQAVLFSKWVREKDPQIERAISSAYEVTRQCIDMVAEEHRLGTAFIIGPHDEIVKMLPNESEIALTGISLVGCNAKDIQGILGIADGKTNAFEVDTTGTIRSLRKLVGAQISSKTAFYPKAIFHELACGGVTVVTGRGESQLVQIFREGKLLAEEVKVEKEGRWSFRNIPELLEELDCVLISRCIEKEVFEIILLNAVEMSHLKMGGIFTLGDHETVIRESSPLLKHGGKEIALNEMKNVRELRSEEIINYAKEDGAMILSKKGDLVGISRHLESSASGKGQKGDGKKTRHQSASDMTVSTKAVAVVVSQNGSISIYQKGEEVFEL